MQELLKEFLEIYAITLILTNEVKSSDCSAQNLVSNTMETTAWTKLITIMLILVSHQELFTESVEVGVNYGFLGNDLPNPTDAVKLLLDKRIPMVRIFEPKIEVLQALKGTSIGVSLGVKNQDLAYLASSQQATTDWINTYVTPFINDVTILFISVGNEVIPGENAQYLLPAIKNFYWSLDAANLWRLELTTVMSGSVLASTYPPSQAVITDQTMMDVLSFLYSKSEPIMVNVYPYFALNSDPSNINLDYALSNSKTPAFTDENLTYYGLFEAMFDSFSAAIAKVVGKDDMDIILSETGWPTAGGQFATVENARIYNNNFKNIALKGTPRYDRPFEAFIFALFNENQKPGQDEQNFGNFYPNMKPVYPLW
ncbi:Glucan endo-1,3-beta-glucosidase [Thalictrum thalictroides]|uniref:Glucan endo-1,3-beta-glucosidase n=1 Tax=Thalictrum thalictroides TaxID=46969 RepID=A0A7J6V321_THATH|nr:Glucan endo-1,3-beta-glucosidase [Thalictrum thalictroides]